MPASFAVRPAGGLTVTAENCWLPSSRRRCTTKGLWAPAIGETAPASKLGAFGCSAAEPEQFWVICQVSEGVAGEASGADHGVSVASVVWSPQLAGVRRAPPAPPKKFSLKFSKGSCGLRLKVALTRPVFGSSVTSPASFATMPVSLSSIVM